MGGQVVLLIHGINSSGEWQDKARVILEPHFRCEVIRYRDYWLFGATKIYVWPWAFLFLVAFAWTAPAWLLAGILGAGSWFLLVDLLDYFLPQHQQQRPWLAPVLSLALAGAVFMWLNSVGVRRSPVNVLWVGSLTVLVCILFCECQWGPHWGAMIVAVLLAATGFFLPRWIALPDELVAWLTLAVLVTFLDEREYGSGSGSRGLVLYPLIVPVVVTALWLLSRSHLLTANVLAVSLLFMYALKEPWSRQARVLQKIHTRFDRISQLHDAPHLIAHSFGTFLSGTLLRDFVTVRVDRIILLGCVLDEAFDWPQLMQTPRRVATAVRNEKGQQDLVVKLAGMMRTVGNYLRRQVPWMQGLIAPRGLGRAGVDGFQPIGATIHEIASDWAECQPCLPPAQIAPIHNVSLVAYAHSTWDHSDINEHARQLWLPFLWRIAPQEHKELLDLCEQIKRFNTTPKNLKALRLARRELAERTWYWPALPSETTVPLPGQPLSWYVHDLLEECLLELPEYIRHTDFPEDKRNSLLALPLVQQMDALQSSGQQHVPIGIMHECEQAVLPLLPMVFGQVIAEGRAALGPVDGILENERQKRVCWLFPPVALGEAIIKALLGSPLLLHPNQPAVGPGGNGGGN